MIRISFARILAFLAISFWIPATFADQVDDLLAPFLQKRFSSEPYESAVEVSRALQSLQEGPDLAGDPRVFSTLRWFLERRDIEGGTVHEVLQYFANLKTAESSREILNFIRVIEPKLSERGYTFLPLSFSALAENGHPSGYFYVRDFLGAKPQNSEAVNAAVRALGILGAEQPEGERELAVSRIRTVLNNGRPSGTLKENAARALGRLRLFSGAKILKSFLDGAQDRELTTAVADSLYAISVDAHLRCQAALTGNLDKAGSSSTE